MLPFPSPTLPAADRAAVLLGYVDYFRSVVLDRLASLDEAAARRSCVPSGWTPAELAWHLLHVERRWLDWGFEGVSDGGDPWADEVDGRWHLDARVTVGALCDALRQRAEASRTVVARHGLHEVGAPGPRWDGAPPATLERVLLHLVQEYARHAGHHSSAIASSFGSSRAGARLLLDR